MALAEPLRWPPEGPSHSCRRQGLGDAFPSPHLTVSFIHSLIYILIQQTFTEHLLYTKLCLRQTPERRQGHLAEAGRAVPWTLWDPEGVPNLLGLLEALTETLLELHLQTRRGGVSTAGWGAGRRKAPGGVAATRGGWGCVAEEGGCWGGAPPWPQQDCWVSRP